MLGTSCKLSHPAFKNQENPAIDAALLYRDLGYWQIVLEETMQPIGISIFEQCTKMPTRIENLKPKP